jgi:glycosyltransferase involved in cell wall biosynthesis
MPNYHNPLKIGFLSLNDPLDPRQWSGIVRSMFSAIQKHWGEVTSLQATIPDLTFLTKICNKASLAIQHKKYNVNHCLVNAWLYGRYFNHILAGKDFDIIFAPAASTQIACVKTSMPIVYAIDATFSAIVDYYAAYSGLSGISIKEGNWIERAALNNASLIISASPWAKQSAMRSYFIEEQKIAIVPLGANLDEIPDEEVVKTKKKSNRCRLLFLGVDWERKGGSIAFDTLLHLERTGTAAELIVCGCIPPSRFKHPGMHVIPFLDKNNHQQRFSLFELFKTSDFLFLPTRAEGFGIVFAEANAFGVPAIATDTGGVSGAIINGENGYLLPPSATGEQYAELISKIYSDDVSYYNLIRSSREAFNKRLNWDSWAQSVREIICEKLRI